MAERVRKAKPAAPQKKAEAPAAQPKKSDAELKAETDALLDDIDAVLEENAEEFVKGYIQKGGQ